MISVKQAYLFSVVQTGNFRLEFPEQLVAIMDFVCGSERKSLVESMVPCGSGGGVLPSGV